MATGLLVSSFHLNGLPSTISLSYDSFAFLLAFLASLRNGNKLRRIPRTRAVKSSLIEKEVPFSFWQHLEPDFCQKKKLNLTIIGAD